MVIKLKQLSSDEHDYDCCRTSQKLGGGQPLPRLVPARRYTIILHTQAPRFFLCANGEEWREEIRRKLFSRADRAR